MRLHNSISFKMNGPLETLNICGFVPMTVEPHSLFRCLHPKCQPIAIPSRRYSDYDKQFIRSEISSLLSSGVIEPSVSPWRAQVIVTQISSHRKRLVVDYSQTINRYTLLHAYPLPLIVTLLHDVFQCNMFSILDLKSAYHQIPIKDDEKHFTAFKTKNNERYYFHQ